MSYQRCSWIYLSTGSFEGSLKSSRLRYEGIVLIFVVEAVEYPNEEGALDPGFVVAVVLWLFIRDLHGCKQFIIRKQARV